MGSWTMNTELGLQDENILEIGFSRMWMLNIIEL
jgi:hypothetical protein